MPDEIRENLSFHFALAVSGLFQILIKPRRVSQNIQHCIVIAEGMLIVQMVPQLMNRIAQLLRVRRVDDLMIRVIESQCVFTLAVTLRENVDLKFSADLLNDALNVLCRIPFRFLNRLFRLTRLAIILCSFLRIVVAPNRRTALRSFIICR